MDTLKLRLFTIEDVDPCDRVVVRITDGEMVTTVESVRGLNHESDQ